MRTLVVAGLMATLLLVGCGAKEHAPSPTSETVAHLDWGMLAPEDWDAMRLLKGIDLGKLQDSDPKAIELLKSVRESWINAPIVQEMDGKRGSLTGYVVPLGGDLEHIREFLLVPYFGACIHTPPPPSNQIVHVHVEGAGISMAGWDAGVTVDGVLAVEHSETAMGTAGYRMSAEIVRPYKDTFQTMGVN